MKHPVGQRAAAAFHAVFVVAYVLALGFHAVSAWRHWSER